MTEYRYWLHGEIDVDTTPQVRADLQRAISTGGAHVLIDCADLTFIDSTAIAVLLEAKRLLEAQGRHMLIVNVQPGPRHVFDLLGLTDLLHERASA